MIMVKKDSVCRWKSLSNSDKRYLFILCILYLWMLWGIFPPYNYEGDSQHIIAGGTVLFNQGFKLPPLMAYQYNMQPIMVYLLAVLKHVFPFLTTNAIYSIFTALISFIFIPLCVELVHRLTQVERDITLVGVILFPECYAIAMYPNSAILPATLMVWAMLLIVKGSSNWKWLLLMCIAPVFRIDIVIVYPVIFFLFLYKEKPFWKSVGLSATAALLIVAFLALVYWLFQANPFYVVGKAGEIDAIADKMIPFMAVMSFYNVVNLILIPKGCYLLLKRGSWKLVLALVVPMLLLHYIYRYNGGAAKHYLYILPFAAVMTVTTLDHLRTWCRQHRWAKYAMLTGLILYYIVSIRFDFPDKPWRNLDTSFSRQGFNIPLFRSSNSPYHPEIGIGSSLAFATADEYMLLSGGLFYSDYIHRIKVRRQTDMANIRECLKKENPDTLNVLTFEWDDWMLYQPILMEEGYILKGKNVSAATLQKGDKLVRTFGVGSDHTEKEMKEKISLVRKNALKNHQPLVILSLYDSYVYILEQLAQKGECKKLVRGLYQFDSHD